jgi:putative ABC transport system permease protein
VVSGLVEASCFEQLMTLLTLAIRNVRRNRLRAVMTALGCAVAILAFVALRTLLSAWAVAEQFAARDRIGTRHKLSYGLTLPKFAIDSVRDTPGVKAATWVTWFGGKNPKNPNDIFISLACDPASMLQVYDEMDVPEAAAKAWLEDRRGAVLGDQLARKLNVKPGDRVTLSGTIYPGDWVFNVTGIYTVKRTTLDRQQFLFHWDYLNESLAGARKDKIGWIISRVDDPDRSATISKAIDRKLDERDVSTLTMSERQMNLSVLGMISALLNALNAVSLIILAIMLLILGNTIAMAVRERTGEYAALRALGFLPKHVGLLVVFESVCIGAAGGLLGLGLSYPLIQQGLGGWLVDNMGRFFPYFRISSMTAMTAVGLAALLGLVAAIIPAVGAMRLSVTDALRRVA